MLIFFGAMSLLVAAFLLSIINFAQKDNKEAVPTACIGGLFAISSIVGIFCLGEHFCPTISPIDVYRGNTTLEITYRDSVAIDSVVVFKNK